MRAMHLRLEQFPGVAAGRWNNNSTINSTISQRRFADHPLFDRQTMTPCARRGWKRRAIEILSAIGQQSGPLRRHHGPLAIAEKRWRLHRLALSPITRETRHPPPTAARFTSAPSLI